MAVGGTGVGFAFWVVHTPAREALLHRLALSLKVWLEYKPWGIVVSMAAERFRARCSVPRDPVRAGADNATSRARHRSTK